MQRSFGGQCDTRSYLKLGFDADWLHFPCFVLMPVQRFEKKENRVSFCLNCSKNRRCEMNNRGLLEISISTQLVQAVIFWCSAAKGMHPSYPLPHPVGPQGKLKMNFACSDPWAKLTIPFAVIEPRLQRRKLCYTTLKLFVK